MSANVIAVIFLALVLIPAFKGFITHMKGEGACCGGKQEHVKPNRLKGGIAKEYRIRVEGMSCDNCKNRIMKVLNGFEAVSARVNRPRKLAVIRCEKDMAPEIFLDCINKLGYNATLIKQTP